MLNRGFSAVGRGWGVAAAFLVLAGPAAAVAATALFPKPLHLVRRIEDSLSAKPATVEEFCAGNRVVSVRGPRVVIVDYDAQQVTEIDHAARTWSMTSFPDIAHSRAELSARLGNRTERRIARLTALGRQGLGGVDHFVASEAHRRLDVAFDRHVLLSRAAAEVLMGAAYPEAKGEEDDDILGAAHGDGDRVSAMSAAQADDGSYALLVERTLAIDEGGTRLVSKNSVTRIGDELPPSDLMLIDPGSKRVESRLTGLARALREADSLPSKH